MKVGFFDSGSWAYHVRDSFLVHNPDIETIVYADYENCPYWDRECEEIIALTKKWVSHLFDQWCDVVILACNTASVHALRHLQNTLPKHQRILGVTYPACEAVRDGNFKNVLVISTDATKKSWIYTHYIHQIAWNKVWVINISIPWLVQAIESNNTSEQQNLIRGALHRIPDKNRDIDAIILGCTHYPIITGTFEEIKNEFPQLEQASIIDPWMEAAKWFIFWREKHFDLNCTVWDSGKKPL